MRLSGKVRRRGWQRVTDPVAGTLVHLLFAMARLLPVDTASAAGGRLARAIGPRLRVSDVARSNLRRVFPEKSPEEIERLLFGVWDNLGRTAAEYPHLERIWDFDLSSSRRHRRVEIVGIEEMVARYVGDSPVIVFAAHLANWELLSVGAARHGLGLAVLYRPPNVPLAASLIDRIRRRAMGELLPTTLSGAIAANRVLEEGRFLGMLVDQHFSGGVRVPFLGHPAWTAPTLARLARRFGCPVHGARVERLGGVRFRVTFTPALALPHSGDAEADITESMARVTAIIGQWIQERPEQWLWLHRRWR